MKTYENESMFVNNFAKDCKEQLKNGQNFEAEVNGINVVVTGMDNNNASKVTIYSGSVNGIEFSGSITALKKRLNVTFKKEYKRSIEASTRVIVKSDEELERTAETATERYKKALAVVLEYSKRYFVSYPADMKDLDTLVVGNESVPTLEEERTKDIILECLKEERDRVLEVKEAEAKKKAEETAKKLADEKAKLEKQLAELQAKLAKMK